MNHGMLLAMSLHLVGAPDDPERLIDPAALRQTIESANRIVVLGGQLEGRPTLYESSEPEDIRSFAAAAAVKPPQHWFYCSCLGRPTVNLLLGDALLVTVTNHHGRTIRASGWEGNAELEDEEAWAGWFAKRGMPEVGQEVQELREQEVEAARDRDRWVAAMPPALVPLERNNPFERASQDVGRYREALRAATPNTQNQVLQLLRWFGSGAGPWSGFPEYEVLAENLLMDYSTSEILAAVEGSELDPQTLEGVARLLGGWTFGQARADDLQALPEDLKRRLLEHSLKSANDDKRKRARRAFSPGTAG